MTTAPETDPAPRFWPLFAIALGVRIGVVALGVLLIPVQPTRPVKVFGIAAAGFPADLGPTRDPASGSEDLRARIMSGSARTIEPWYRWDA